MCLFGSQPQREGHHRGTHSKESPKSSYQQHSHELCSPPFPAPDSPMFHTLCSSCFSTELTIQSPQSSVDPAVTHNNPNPITAKENFQITSTTPKQIKKKKKKRKPKGPEYDLHDDQSTNFPALYRDE